MSDLPITDLSFLIGKTITSASFRGIGGFADVPYLDLTFSDGTKCTVTAQYGGYSEKEEDEYARFIEVDYTQKTNIKISSR